MTGGDFCGLLAGSLNPVFGTQNERAGQSAFYGLLYSLKMLRNSGKHVAHNGLVAGSSPAGPTSGNLRFRRFLRSSLWRDLPRPFRRVAPVGSPSPIPFPVFGLGVGGGFARGSEPAGDFFVHGLSNKSSVVLAFRQHGADALFGAGHEPDQHRLMFVLGSRHASP